MPSMDTSCSVWSGVRVLKARTCFRVEEVYNRQENCIQHGPHNPKTPADILNSDWCYLDNGEVGYPFARQSGNFPTAG
jgi:hypothetical protein